MNRTLSPAAPADWTVGEPAIVFQHCAVCAHRWYFARSFCPRCGADEPATERAEGSGVVHAITTVQRAPTDSLRAALPYTVALVDCNEGFRMLAHAEAGLAVGDPVQAGFRTFDGGLVPFFRRHPTD
ncbi:MAG: Zn-ribbon domain-containing OB-fold protein [Burkholderiaceae bacterium]